MKKTLLSAVFTVIIAVAAQAQTKIYEFSFDNSYSATVGTGNFTSNSGTSFTTDRHGNANGALRIDNKGTTATLLGLPYGSLSRTISLWVNLNSIFASYNFLYNYGKATASEGAFINPTKVTNYLPSHSSNLTNSLGIWYHFVFSYNGTYSKIYRDGVLISSSAVSKNTLNNLDIFTLGLTEKGLESYFDGAIDDLKIFDYALSDAEVGDLHTVGIKDLYLTNNTISVYPNPTKNQINFSVLTNVQLTNVTGQIIAEKKNVNTLDLSHLSSGMYFLTLSDNKGQILQRNKIVKE